MDFYPRKATVVISAGSNGRTAEGTSEYSNVKYLA